MHGVSFNTITLLRGEITMNEKDMILPTEFVENRFIVQPKTLEGTTIRIFTDTGGDCFITPKAAKKANLFISEGVINGSRMELAEPPTYRESDWIPPLIIRGETAKYPIFAPDQFWNEDLDGMLGQAWFANRVWTFDYLAGKMIYHTQWKYENYYTGHRIQLSFQVDSNNCRTYNFPRIQATIDGETIDFLFDTGATLILSNKGIKELNKEGKFIGTSFITQTIFNQWITRHPDWRVIEHAEHNTGLPIIEVPEVSIAGYTVGPVWFTMRPDHNFHEYMSQWMDKQIEGALGGSAFQFFRITVDYQDGTAYFMRED